MRHILPLLLAVPALCLSANAAASDLAADDAAPGVHLSFSFGGAAAPFRLQAMPEAAAVLKETGSGGASAQGLSSTTTWVIVGVVAVAVVVVAASSHHGGSSGGGGY